MKNVKICNKWLTKIETCDIIYKNKKGSIVYQGDEGGIVDEVNWNS